MTAARDQRPNTIALDIAELRRDGGTQPRAAMDRTAVAEYADAIKAGAEMPPIVAFYDGTSYWLADGFHRVSALGLAGKRSALVVVHQGTKRDAVLYSVGTNAAHGLRRSSADKRRAVETLLSDEEWGGKSDRWIAKACAVSHPFVAKVRAESGGNASASREGQDGKSYPAPAPEPPDDDGDDDGGQAFGGFGLDPDDDGDDLEVEPEPQGSRKWRDVLGLAPGAVDSAEVLSAYRQRTREGRPESVQFEELDRAKALALSQWDTQDREADMMVAIAGLYDEDDDIVVLEPSAGTGALVRAVRRAQPGAHIIACEVDPARAQILRGEGMANEVFEGDFLTSTAGDDPTIHIAIANTPYENGADGRFLEKLMGSEAGTIVALVRLNALAGTGRFERVWSNVTSGDWNLSELVILKSRPGFDGPGEDGARSDYAIVRLDRVADAGAETVVSWR